MFFPYSKHFETRPSPAQTSSVPFRSTRQFVPLPHSSEVRTVFPSSTLPQAVILIPCMFPVPASPCVLHFSAFIISDISGVFVTLKLTHPYGADLHSIQFWYLAIHVTLNWLSIKTQHEKATIPGRYLIHTDFPNRPGSDTVSLFPIWGEDKVCSLSTQAEQEKWQLLKHHSQRMG